MRPLAFAVAAWAFGVVAAAGAPSQPRGDKEGITPSHVFARLELLSAEIELVRREIGAPKDPRPAIVVKGAKPRDNYFQALSLNRKAQRLCLDLTGEEGVFPPSAPAPERIRPADVLGVVDAAVSNVRRVKAHLGVVEQSREPPPDPTKTPSDVFRSIVGVSRQLSLMLDTQPTPTMVFEQLTEAVGTANRLLARFPGAAQVAAPPFERGKTPADVHARLMRCMERLGGIAKHLGWSPVEVDWRLPSEQVTPSDVYDVATMLVAELHYLESRFPRSAGSPALTDFPPGRKFPAHNVQRAGLLEAQLAEIRKQIDANPDLLKQR